MFQAGASYYPEVIDRAQWENDLATGREIGLSVLRCGEFAWATFAPTTTTWDASWAVDFLNLAQRHGYKVIWCTPSATPPPYVFDAFPDLHAVNANGHRTPVGIRRHYCPTHPDYLDLCADIAARLARDLARHPAIMGWQVDNELAGDGFTCWCDRCGSVFQQWLAQRYGSLDELNQRWQTGVWSQRYTAWTQIPVPRKPFDNHAPSLKLDYRRFRSDAWLTFYRRQRDALRSAGTGPVTTNFYNLSWDVPFDHWDWRPHLDALGVSHYEQEETASRLQLALLRGPVAGDRPLWVLEQKAGQQLGQNIASDHPERLANHLHWCRTYGAECGIYWHYRQHAAGCECEHGAVVRHDGRPGRTARAITQAIAATRNVNASTPNPDALFLFSFAQHWAVEQRPAGGARWDYRVELQEHWYPGTCDALGDTLIGAPRDIKPRHRLIVCPLASMQEDGLSETLRPAVHAGATLLITADFCRLDACNNVQRRAPLAVLNDWGIQIPDIELLRAGAKELLFPSALDEVQFDSRLYCAVPRTGTLEPGLGTVQAEQMSVPLAVPLNCGRGRIIVTLSSPNRLGVATLLRRLK